MVMFVWVVERTTFLRITELLNTRSRDDFAISWRLSQRFWDIFIRACSWGKGVVLKYGSEISISAVAGTNVINILDCSEDVELVYKSCQLSKCSCPFGLLTIVKTKRMNPDSNQAKLCPFLEKNQNTDPNPFMSNGSSFFSPRDVREF